METATTQPSVAPVSQEAQFQSLFDQGAFDATKPPEEVKDIPRTEDGKFDKPEPEKEPKAPSGPEIKTEASEPDPKEEEQPEEYSHLEELLKAKGIDPESVKTLPVTVKIDGKEQSVPLAEVIKSFQLEGHVNNKSIELSNQQKQFHVEQEAARNLIKQQLEQNKALTDLAMNQLTAEFNQVDWNGLRASNPGQYAALYTDFQAKQQAIQNHLAQVNQQQQIQAQKDMELLEKNVNEQRNLMYEKHPDWKDPQTFKKVGDTITGYAKQIGFTDAELSKVTDHRLMQLLHDAASFQALQAQKPTALKQVREAPKLAKAGTRNIVDPKSAARTAAIERFNANPRDIDAQAALFGVLSE